MPHIMRKVKAFRWMRAHTPQGMDWVCLPIYQRGKDQMTGIRSRVSRLASPLVPPSVPLACSARSSSPIFDILFINRAPVISSPVSRRRSVITDVLRPFGADETTQDISLHSIT